MEDDVTSDEENMDTPVNTTPLQKVVTKRKPSNTVRHQPARTSKCDRKVYLASGLTRPKERYTTKTTTLENLARL